MLLITSTPIASSRDRTSGTESALLISAFSRTTSSRGMPAGPNIAYQTLISKPGSVSATVGTSGSRAERFASVTASSRSLPAFTCGSVWVPAENSTWVWLATVSSTAGAPPLYGTCSMWMPAALSNISALRWLVEPEPAEA